MQRLEETVFILLEEVITLLKEFKAKFETKKQGCNTVATSAAYDIAISVGSIDVNLVLAWDSSVGPGLSTKPLTKDSISVGVCSTTGCGNQNKTGSLIKLTIVAPGVGNNSSVSTNDTSYACYSGTSMTTPHVTGVVALMIYANPTLKWSYKKVYKILTATTDTSRIDLLGERQNKDNAVHTQTNLMCNMMYSNIYNSYPNNMYGYGLVDACKAVAASTQLSGGYNFGWW